MKNALKCVFESLDLVKIWETGTIFSEKGRYLKKCFYEPHSLSSHPWLSNLLSTSPKIMELCQITKLDMGFQKNNILGRFKKHFFSYERCFYQASFSDSCT